MNPGELTTRDDEQHGRARLAGLGQGIPTDEA